MAGPDPESFSWFRLLLATSTVIALMGGLAFVLKYAAMKGWTLPALQTRGMARRLRVLETLPLDARRRLVLVQCDDRAHLLLLGSASDSLVAANLDLPPLPAPAPSPAPNEAS